MAGRPVHIIGVPLDLGAGHRGVDMGPSALRIAGLERELERLGYEVLDKGDVPAPVPETRDAGDPRKKYIGEIAAVCETLFRWAQSSHERGAIPLVVGGDHSLAAGSIGAAAAAARAASRPLGLMWIDAHADMNTPQSTLSGNEARYGTDMIKQMQKVSPDSIKMAITIVTIVPIIAVYPFLQRFFVRGLVIGAVKG